MRMNINPARWIAFLAVSAITLPAVADPCGMVPPIYLGEGVPITRVGEQKTYVFFKDGVETFVIRPGFSGKVEQFGMLIPFPQPPAIRKVPDHIFAHVAAAIDPPEVIVDLIPKPRAPAALGARFRGQAGGGALGINQVRVLREEAVGMYEVAVLAAGSAQALQRWMDDHGYKYPQGMDRACNDYVDEGWCFVAVKTKVGPKSGVDPRPGQRAVDAKLPTGATFDGQVQAMGFRFHVDELVVPMRLSSFNAGELRNIVYLVTDGPRKVRAIPEEYVVRQISGRQLFQNVTEPLPVRLIGGASLADIPDWRKKSLDVERNPEPKNGAAKELFASDLLSVKTKSLSLPHEEREKELLRIGERFGLRGAEIDRLNGDALAAERTKTVEGALAGLQDLTLTVIDGDFPREVLGAKNLSFGEYKMPARRNAPQLYDAKRNGPAPKTRGVRLIGKALVPEATGTAPRRPEPESATERSIAGSPRFWIPAMLSAALVGLAIAGRRRMACLLIVAAVLALVPAAMADPCGMVPPIYLGEGPPITRIGEQQTYVFHKDGVETFVIRPGFSGKVDEFGMLIPFPTPPAIRKVPDHIFPHLAAAVDPPEVVVDLRVQFPLREATRAQAGAPFDATADGGLKYHQVRVVKQEAVGMYEVAVLEAGSADALKRWLDQHGYKYPEGMDKPCNEYVAEGWCFVAVKTKVGQKQGVEPRPGQRGVNAKLPTGSTFDGSVQAMGFRFKSEKLVVPMRLSAFNAGELRNIVYILTDGPRRIRSIPEEYVVRQVAGEQLFSNVTQPLPLRIIGGSEADIPDYRRKNLPKERDPAPHNGAAKELFASDLLAIGTQDLTLPHEEREKELLRIGERFGLRGAEIDKINEAALAVERAKTVERALAEVKQMTLTVVDGDFPREVLGSKNLTFAQYKMPARRNKPELYDAKNHAPGGKKEGVLKLGRLDDVPNANPGGAERAGEARVALRPAVWISAGLSAVLFGFVLLRRRR